MQRTKLEGYKKTDLIGEDETSASRLVHMGHRAKGTGGHGLITVDEWVELFNNCWGKNPKYANDAEAITTLATRMAKTDPMEAFEFNRGAVVESNIVNAWLGRSI